MKPVTVTLRLSRDDRTYSAGELLEGTVCLETQHDIKLKALFVRLYGYGRVSWDEKRAYTKGAAGIVEMKNTEVYLDHSLSLLKRADDDDMVSVSPGTYTYPFAYELPPSLPASFQGKWGVISYSARLSMERAGWRADDIEREQDITVRASYDLNEEPELVRPIGAAADFQPVRVLCCVRGQVAVELRLRRRGYSPGEQIPFWLQLTNNSHKMLFDAKVALLQHVIFRAGAKVKRVTSVVGAATKGEIPSGRTEVWDGDHIDIPHSMVCSTTARSPSKVLTVKYTLTFSVRYSTWSSPFTLPVTILMGSVGLRANTIKTYLQLLGISQTGSSSNLNHPAPPTLTHSPPSNSNLAASAKDTHGEG